MINWRKQANEACILLFTVSLNTLHGKHLIPPCLQNHIITEMGGRNDETPPSPRDLKIIALQAELEEYKKRDSKTNQIINELARKSRDLENEVCFARFDTKHIASPVIIFNVQMHPLHREDQGVIH